MPTGISPPKDYICAVCGAKFKGLHNSKYCPSCAKERERASMRASHERNRKPRQIPTRPCEVCGKPFYCIPSAQHRLRTCSPECATQQRRNRCLSEAWEAVESKKVEGVKNSPISGAFETNIHAKSWTIKAPSGEIYEVRNLRLWLDNNSHLLDGTPKQAYNGITNIKAALLKQQKNAAKQWKGWRLLDWKDE